MIEYISLLVGFGHAVAYTAIGFIIIMPLIFLIKEAESQRLPWKILKQRKKKIRRA